MQHPKPSLRTLWVPLAAGLAALALWAGHAWSPGPAVRAPGAPHAAPAPVPPHAGLLPTGLGALVDPVPAAQVVSGFGWAERSGRPVFQSFVRLSVEPGARLRAIAAGAVAAIRDDPGEAGLYVVVAHDRGWASMYGGCGTVLVRVGQRVAPAAAVCAAPGGVQTAAAAFGLLQAGHPVNPAPYVRLG